MITQRFNAPNEWGGQIFFLGLIDMIKFISNNLSENSIMIEIGSYMGESTMLFGCSGKFKEIYAIDPHSGNEEFNQLFGYNWDIVKKEFEINTRFFDNIIYIQNYSYNVVNQFEDNSIDFIYIDGNHNYESVKKDLELYIPKLKVGGYIGGHDYYNHWDGVVKAINEIIGEPDYLFEDLSWIYQIKNIDKTQNI